MILSQNEKRALIQRQREIEQFENEMVRKYAEEQQSRQNMIQAKKDELESAKEGIFKRLE